MFIKIQEEILEVSQILRVRKDIDTEYKMTEEYAKWREEHKFDMFSIIGYPGKKYTDEVLKNTYTLFVDTGDFDELEFTYETEEDLNGEFDYIWNTLPKEVF